MGEGTCTLAVLGGSSAFTPALAGVLAGRADEVPPLEVRLHGRDPVRLEAVVRSCNLHARARGVSHVYHAALTVREAASGAAFVLNQMRIGGWAGRIHDEVFPLRFGFPGDETVGPGGLASAVRGLPVVLEAAAAVQDVAPDAWFVNLTNPMGILLAGLGRIPGLKTFGLCELPGVTLQRALHLIGLEPGGVEADYLGLNHQGWFVRVAEGGRDRLPDILSAVAELPTDSFFQVDARVMKRLGALPLPYMRLYYHTFREANALRNRSCPRGRTLEALSAELYAHYARSREARLPELLEQRATVWYEDWVSTIRALCGGKAANLYVSGRNGGAVAGLPEGAVVETLSRLDAAGPEAVPFTDPALFQGGKLERFLSFLRRVVRFEEAAVEAAMDPSGDRIVAALRLHPFEIDPDTARAMVPEVLKPVHRHARNGKW